MSETEALSHSKNLAREPQPGATRNYASSYAVFSVWTHPQAPNPLIPVKDIQVRKSDAEAAPLFQTRGATQSCSRVPRERRDAMELFPLNRPRPRSAFRDGQNTFTAPHALGYKLPSFLPVTTSNTQPTV